MSLSLIVMCLVAGQKPDSLTALEQSRAALYSGRVEWSVLPHGDADSGRPFVSRYARDGDLIFEIRPDKDGWTETNPDQPSPGPFRAPQIFLANADGRWHYQETGLLANWWGDTDKDDLVSDALRDVRGLGIYPTPQSLKGGPDSPTWYSPGVEILEWDETQAAGKYIAMARCSGGVRLTWEIDPAKGWNAERVTLETPTYRREAVSTLKQYGQVWFPESTDYYEDGRLMQRVIVTQASFNQPSDPARFAPGDMGMEAGTNITAQHLGPGVGKVLFWNGDSVSTQDEWFADVREGRRQWGPTFQALQRGEPRESPYITEEGRRAARIAAHQLQMGKALAEHEGLWERYVEQFIARYRLNAEQSERARRVLRDCQDKARRVLSRKRAELTSLHEQIARANNEHDDQRVAKLGERIVEARAPVDEIFEQDLKPRLERIPTRAQRKMASAPDSRPAGPRQP